MTMITQPKRTPAQDVQHSVSTRSQQNICDTRDTFFFHITCLSCFYFLLKEMPKKDLLVGTF
jgi:hypothetical protein